MNITGWYASGLIIEKTNVELSTETFDKIANKLKDICKMTYDGSTIVVYTRHETSVVTLNRLNKYLSRG